MKVLFTIPLITAALLFTGCEATIVDRGPVSGRRHGYYEGRPSYYDDRPNYSRTYSRSRPVESSYYGRSRAPYRSDSVYRQDTVVNRTNVTVNRTNVNRTNVNRTNVNRTDVRNTRYQGSVKKKSKGEETRVRVNL